MKILHIKISHIALFLLTLVFIGACTAAVDSRTGNAGTANAGANQNLKPGVEFTLDASESIIPTSRFVRELKYVWSIPGIGTMEGKVVTGILPTGIPSSGRYNVTLVITYIVIVNEQNNQSGLPTKYKYSDSMILFVSNGQTPIANAGENQEVNSGDNFTLDGTGSIAPSGNIAKYEWIIPTIGIREGAIITEVFPIFTGANQSYSVTLNVTDSFGNKASDTMRITVKSNNNNPPVADAGADIIVRPGDTFRLDGSASIDPDNDIVKYEWSIGDGMEGVIVTSIVSEKGNTPYSFSVMLTVTDSKGNLDRDFVTIFVRDNYPPVANAGADQSVVLGDTFTLDGSGSSDPDNNIISYVWRIPGKAGTTRGKIVTAVLANNLSPGRHPATLTVTDDRNNTHSDDVDIIVISNHIVMQIENGDRQVRLNWEEVSIATSYNLYYATESLARLESLGDYESLENGKKIEGIIGATTLIKHLINFNEYYFVVEAITPSIFVIKSSVVQGIPVGTAETPLYFSASELCENNYEPWKTDGTLAGTNKIKDINMEGNSVIPSDNSYIFFKGFWYFLADADNRPYYEHTKTQSVWKTDGTEARTTRVTDDKYTNISLNKIVNGKLTFTAHYDGSKSKTNHAIARSGVISPFSHRVGENSIQFGSTTIFQGSGDSLTDRDIAYMADGLTISPIENSGEYIIAPKRFIRESTIIYYFTVDRTKDKPYTLWRMYTTGGNPLELASFLSVNKFSGLFKNTDAYDQMIGLSHKLYFNANDGIHGHTLWVSDASVSGTKMVKDLDGTPADTVVEGLAILGNKLIFHSRHLWVSDGTSDGTKKIYDVYRPQNVDIGVVSGNLYYFSGSVDEGKNYVLWVSNGTTDGTYKLKDVYEPYGFIEQGGIVFFHDRYERLWRSDGTEEGTFMLGDIHTNDSEECGA